MEVEALVNTLHHSLTKVEAETPGDKLRDVKTDALANTLDRRDEGRQCC